MNQLDMTKHMKIWYKIDEYEYIQDVISIGDAIVIESYYVSFVDENGFPTGLMIDKYGKQTYKGKYPMKWRAYNEY